MIYLYANKFIIGIIIRNRGLQLLRAISKRINSQFIHKKVHRFISKMIKKQHVAYTYSSLLYHLFVKEKHVPIRKMSNEAKLSIRYSFIRYFYVYIR